MECNGKALPKKESRVRKSKCLFGVRDILREGKKEKEN